MYFGIAFAGKKGSGKDTLVDYLLATRENVEVFRCKTPIVEAYEEQFGPYDKQRDDRKLIVFSRMLRAENDEICAEWLASKLPPAIERGVIPLVPDMRRLPESRALNLLSMMCIKVECNEDVRLSRIQRRDGTLDNYQANDVTETDVDLIHCPYLIDNTKDDGGQFAFKQLESYLSRHGPLFQPRPDLRPFIERHGAYLEGAPLDY